MTEPTGQPDEQTTVGWFTPPAVPAQGHPTQPLYPPQQAYHGAPQPYAYPGQFAGTPPAPAPVRKKRTFAVISFVIAGLLVLCGGVATTAVLVTGQQSGTGQATPASAVDRFLTAVYIDKDPVEAARYVCADSPNSSSLTSKVNELKSADTKFQSPHYGWNTPTIATQTGSEATVDVTVTMTTLDKRTADEKLVITTVRSHGWWVCAVTTGK